MNDQQDAIGFLGSNGVLYCSRTCALSRGIEGEEVGQDDFEAFLEGDPEALSPGSLCPVCGTEFLVSWPDRQPD